MSFGTEQRDDFGWFFQPMLGAEIKDTPGGRYQLRCSAYEGSAEEKAERIPAKPEQSRIRLHLSHRS